ncbi:P-loop containing nucleoside triphosphate hydrolase protein [Melampsora americana]|nr:P-loop containing nucleoside triphosphate hydrolase protein [Melampsora americana]
MGLRVPELSMKTSQPKVIRFSGSNSDDDSDGLVNSSGPRRQRSRHLKNGPNKQNRQARADALALIQQALPVYAGKEAILREIHENDTIVVLGETGCGKTTQIPQYILGQEYRELANMKRKIRVVVTQPRRVAAISLATRVAEEVGCELGSQVGYTVRFDDCSNSATALKYVTDGTLLQELLSDELLSAYDVVILDEVHERSLRTDMLMGFVKSIQSMRKEMVERKLNFPNKGSGAGAGCPARPLKIVVMSATLDAQRFAEFFDNAKVIYIQGRQHPVTIYFSKEPQTDYIEAAVKTSLQIHKNQPPGDVLVFLAGQEDIESMQSQLMLYAKDLVPSMTQMMICPLYAKLPTAQQQQVFVKTPPHTRKFILATNVAETSITIPGVSYVIDAGIAKIKRHHSLAGVEELRAEAISQSSADQRSGRAGRESPGKCWRLYPEEQFATFAKITEPEIKRCSLSFAVLHLLASGVSDVFKFDFMDPPDTGDLKFALLHLVLLGAVNPTGKLSALGHQMAKLPLDPPQARCLLASFENECAQDMIDLLALLEHHDTLLINTSATREQAQEVRRRFLHRDGDHIFLLNILRSFESLSGHNGTEQNRGEIKSWCRTHHINYKSMTNVLKSRQQLRERCKRADLDWSKSTSDYNRQNNGEGNSEPLLTSLLTGLSTNIAVRQQDRTYLNPVTKIQIKIHPSSSLHGKAVEAFIYHELVHTSATFARTCSYIKPSWIRDKVPALDT